MAFIAPGSDERLTSFISKAMLIFLIIYLLVLRYMGSHTVMVCHVFISRVSCNG